MNLMMNLAALLLSTFSFAADTGTATTVKELKAFQPLHDCYKAFQKSSEQNAQKTGIVFIEAKLNPSGKIIKTKEVSGKSTLHEDLLSSCVAKSLKGLTLTSEASGKQKTVFLPIEFPLNSN